MYKLLILAFSISVSGGVKALALPPIEAYGELPEISTMSLSPDGQKVAFLANADGANIMTVFEIDKGNLLSLGTNKTNARSVRFASDKYVILRASETTRLSGYRGRFKYSAAFSVNLENRDFVQMLRRTEDLYPAQSGLGRILGVVEDEEKVYMPAYMGAGDNPSYNLLKVDLDNGRGRRFVRGRNATIDWFVDADGMVLAREDYNNDKDEYKIWTRRSGDWELVYETESELVPFSLVGVKQDKSGLVLIDTDVSGYSALYELGFDGEFSEEIFARDEASVERVLVDENRIVYGVEYGGMVPSYEFFDTQLTTDIEEVQLNFGGNSAYVEGWSKDFSSILLFVTGGSTSGQYYIFDRNKKQLRPAASSRPDIPPEFVAPMDIISYKSRDGLKIPAIINWPLGVAPEDRKTKKRPLIVMPHGGPEAYDSLQFDWMAQYFASRGYYVLQPNFRGSAGFGSEFLMAGRGEWGGKMQDDVTDGVDALIRSGYVDPDRVCIVGASYGGYSALAGGAFTPDLYRCVAAIAPVSDLPRMLDQERRDAGSDHWVYTYWQRLIGDRKAEREKLKQISPVNHAESFQAPVLLIHGRDDIIVPISQSNVMAKALQRAGKEVELIRLRGEDHYLSSSETRLETLKALDAFIVKHLREG